MRDREVVSIMAAIIYAVTRSSEWSDGDSHYTVDDAVVAALKIRESVLGFLTSDGMYTHPM